MFDPEITATFISSGIAGASGLAAYLYRRRSKRREEALNVMQARFWLVCHLFDLAQGRGNLDEARKAYQELLLVAQTQRLLGQELVPAVKRFNTRILKPYQAGHLDGSRMAQRIRVTADEFNSLLPLSSMPAATAVPVAFEAT